MYESESFSQMFKRTKKCCAKLLRKISFNTITPSRSQTRTGGSQSPRYTQQRDRPESVRSSPQGLSKGWYPNRKKNVNAGSISGDMSQDEDECETPRTSPKLFSSRGKSYMRVEEISHADWESSASKRSSGSAESVGRYFTSVNNTGSRKAVILRDNDVVLADSELWIGMHGMNNESDSRQKEFTHKANESMATTMPSNSTADGKWNNHKNETTSFIIAHSLMEKFDSYLNVAAQNLRNTLSPRVSKYSVRPDGGRFYHSLEFDILKEDTSDTPSYQESEGFFNDGQVVFEKVNYNKNKRYLRHTPSNSSTGSTTSSPKSGRSTSLVSVGKTHSIFSFGDALLVGDNSTKFLTLCDNETNRRTSDDCNGSSQYDLDDNENVSSLPNRYFIQRDRNGNSYDNHKALFGDPWDMFDNKVNTARDKRLLLLCREDCLKGSAKSSSTTLETWVDDEVFDNSVNEELERKYIPLAN